MNSEEFARCVECNKIFEMPTRYFVDINDDIKQPGLCFSHLPSQQEKKEALGHRIAHLGKKYRVSFLQSFEKDFQGSPIFSNVVSLWERARENNPYIEIYELESALAKFAFEKGRDEAPCAVIGTFLPTESLDMAVVWNALKKNNFKEAYFSTMLRENQRLVILADTPDIVGFTDHVISRIENSGRSPLLCLGIASSFHCHKKRDEDFEKQINNLYNKGVMEYARRNKEEKISRVVNA